MDAQLKDQTLVTAIKLKAIELNAKDKTGADVLAFIDKSKVTANADGTFSGIDEQFKTLQETKSYFFDESGTGGTGTEWDATHGSGGGGGGAASTTTGAGGDGGDGVVIVITHK